jgi:hypothetical protein
MRTAIVFGLLVAATPTLGAYFDGNALNDLCRSDKRSALFYVMGATDQIEGLCVPSNASSSQALDIVCASLARNPETRTDYAASLARAALVNAWPCAS